MPDDPKPMAPPLSMHDMHAILSDEVHRIRDGQTTAASVNAISNAVGKILSSVKLQMEYFRLTGQKVDIPLLGGSPVAPSPPDEKP